MSLPCLTNDLCKFHSCKSLPKIFFDFWESCAIFQAWFEQIIDISNLLRDGVKIWLGPSFFRFVQRVGEIFRELQERTIRGTRRHWCHKWACMRRWLRGAVRIGRLQEFRYVNVILLVRKMNLLPSPPHGGCVTVACLVVACGITRTSVQRQRWQSQKRRQPVANINYLNNNRVGWRNNLILEELIQQFLCGIDFERFVSLTAITCR